MTANERLRLIDQKKQKLKDKLKSIQPLIEQNQQSLISKAKFRKQKQYDLLQKQYLKRKNQNQKITQVQKIKNQKKINELQIAMKKIMIQEIQDNVQKINSQSLLKRSLNQKIIVKKIMKDKEKSTDLIQEYHEQKKYDLQTLQNKKKQFIKKQKQIKMKQLLYEHNESWNNRQQQNESINVFKMTSNQLQQQLNLRGIQVKDQQYQEIKKIKNIQQILQNTNERIKRYKFQLQSQQQKIEKITYTMGQKAQMIRSIVRNIIDETITDYENRYENKKYEILKKINRQKYKKIQEEQMIQQWAQDIQKNINSNVFNRTIKETAEEMYKLHQFAHTQALFCFGLSPSQDINEYFQNPKETNLKLSFVKDKKIKKIKENHINVEQKKNVLNAQQLTVPLSIDFSLLQAEEKYFRKVKIVTQKQQKIQGSLIYYLKEKLYHINANQISVNNNKIITCSIANPTEAKKVGNVWLIKGELKNSQTEGVNILTLVNQNYVEPLLSKMGNRISNHCGIITAFAQHPITTFLGTFCSVWLGFKMGQIVKYNYNRNRLTNIQKGRTHYHSMVQHQPEKQEPLLPISDNKHLIIDDNSTPKVHTFREFFDYHHQTIIFLGFYKYDCFISVDSKLQCAFWKYPNPKPIQILKIDVIYEVYSKPIKPRKEQIDLIKNQNQLYVEYFENQTMLSLQIYNDIKKKIAYYKKNNSLSVKDINGDVPVIQISYSRQKVQSIICNYYNLTPGNIQGMKAKMIKNSLYILCFKQHIIKKEIKHARLYVLKLKEKSLYHIALQIDLMINQKIQDFFITQKLLTANIKSAVFLAQGKIMMFSITSGQMLANISLNKNIQHINFCQICSAQENSYFYGISKNEIIKIILVQKHTNQQKLKANKKFSIQ